MHTSLLAAAVTVFFAPYATADQVSLLDQNYRSLYNEMSEEACDGNRNSFERLERAAFTEQEPAAMNALAWLILAKQCAFRKYDKAKAIDLQRRAADLGYPIAQSNYGARLIKGDGVNRNTDLGIELLKRASDGGYGTASLLAGEYLVQGKYLKQNLTRAGVFFLKASQDDVNRDRLLKLENAIYDAGGTIPEPFWTEKWGTYQAQAYWDFLRDGSFVARVFFGQSDHLGGYYTSGPIN